ncbi:MAG: hypothetical protein P8P30_07225 [Rickettsiales bacterium]|nr:hypothetical protein [Rickettsiales bacterium]
MVKKISHLIEAGLMLFLFGIFRLLPLDMASSFGGKLGQFIGPRLKWHKIATYNLIRAFPDWNEAKRADTLHKMWDNLGRTFAETPWLGHQKFANRVTITQKDSDAITHFKQADRPCVFFGAHLANWEIIPWVGALENIEITSIYRHLNNPYVEKIYYKIRNRYCNELHPKGKRGARALLKAMSKNGQAGLLVDQKQNDGEEIEFFGNPAPTSTAAAEMALRFNSSLAAIRCIRQKECHFTVEVQELTLPENTETLEAMRLINQQIEQWVIEHPEQWLWVHQRWGKLSQLPTISV